MSALLRSGSKCLLLATLLGATSLAQAEADPCAADYAVRAVIGRGDLTRMTGITFSYGPKQACWNTRKVAFEINNDGQNWLPLANAPYVSGLQTLYAAGKEQAVFTVGAAGTYNMRAVLDSGEVVGPTSVTAP